jgi:hypothetical protein
LKICTAINEMRAASRTARLAGQRANLLTQWSNRFWIGQPRLGLDCSASRAK